MDFKIPLKFAEAAVSNAVDRELPKRRTKTKRKRKESNVDKEKNVSKKQLDPRKSGGHPRSGDGH